MTGAELRIACEVIGISLEWFAEHEMDLNDQDWKRRRWESGRLPVPQRAVARIQQMHAEFREAVEQTAAELRRSSARTLVTYRSAKDFHAAEPARRYPASWHRMVAAQVAARVEGVMITYPLDTLREPDVRRLPDHQDDE